MFENSLSSPLNNGRRTLPGEVAREQKRALMAIVIGGTVIVASISLGSSYAFFIGFLAFSFFMTSVWKDSDLPWIFLVSVTAATPIAISREQFACNVVFAIWFALRRPHYLFQLPKWIYILFILMLTGIFSSSINWLFSRPTIIGSMMHEGANILNFIIAPFLLLPMVYVRMRESRDPAAMLRGLLFCLIIPSTVILISARLLGSVANAWEASQHVQSIGFFDYKLGKVIVTFLRTEIGFILAALVCASTAVAISPVRLLYRVIAGACILSNVFLFLTTASFGSIFSCILGIIIIYYTGFGATSYTKMAISVLCTFCIVVMVYSLLPDNLKSYVQQRYQTRITDRDTDRLALWTRAAEQIIRHPEGIGFSLQSGDLNTFTHNDYLAYTVSYGIAGGLAYLFLLCGLLISFMRMRRYISYDPSQLAVYLAGLGVIAALAANSMTDNMISSRWYFNINMSIVWYSYFCSRPSQN